MVLEEKWLIYNLIPVWKNVNLNKCWLDKHEYSLVLINVDLHQVEHTWLDLHEPSCDQSYVIRDILEMTMFWSNFMTWEFWKSSLMTSIHMIFLVIRSKTMKLKVYRNCIIQRTRTHLRVWDQFNCSNPKSTGDRTWKQSHCLNSSKSIELLLIVECDYLAGTSSNFQEASMLNIRGKGSTCSAR